MEKEIKHLTIQASSSRASLQSTSLTKKNIFSSLRTTEIILIIIESKIENEKESDKTNTNTSPAEPV